MAAKKVPILPLESPIQSVPTDDLFLDVENPRLRGTAKNANQDVLLEQLWTEYALDELLLSIAKKAISVRNLFSRLKKANDVSLWKVTIA
jgi:hypothetical protein